MVLNLHTDFGEMSCIFCGHNSVISFSFICSIFKYFILGWYLALLLKIKDYWKSLTAVRTRCWTYTVLDVHKKCTSNTMISQFPETTEMILHDVYIAYNKCTLHHRWYILFCFRLMRIWKNVCSWCWTYITKVVKLAKTVMEKTYNMNFPFTYHCKLYLLTL